MGEDFADDMAWDKVANRDRTSEDWDGEVEFGLYWRVVGEIEGIEGGEIGIAEGVVVVETVRNVALLRVIRVCWIIFCRRGVFKWVWICWRRYLVIFICFRGF